MLKARVTSTDINKHTHCTHHNHFADNQSNKNEYTKVYNMPILIKQNIKKLDVKIPSHSLKFSNLFDSYLTILKYNAKRSEKLNRFVHFLVEIDSDT